MHPAVSEAVAAGGRARRWRRAALAAAGGAGVIALAVGAMHLPFVARLRGTGGCPVGGKEPSPVQIDEARRLFAAGARGGARAPSRPAVGFVLDHTTVDEVREWATRAGVSCEKPRGWLVTCANVPTATGVVDELDLGFDAHGRLVNVTTIRKHLDPGVAATTARDIAASLAGELGPPTTSGGVLDAEHAGTPGAASLATVSYRFSDYVADVTVLNLVRTGPSVREHYMSAAD